MPIYEYECKDCSHCFEVLLLFSSDPPPQCPECQCKREEYTGVGGMLDPTIGPSFSGGSS
ncbi:MAG: zinc ribbon domain-containing protein [Deltaproteobacteria bacterium]|nr:zinc ribbon domain-containing protein [Deltaproteobacteria bacterium]